jgi:hypothetical protein
MKLYIGWIGFLGMLGDHPILAAYSKGLVARPAFERPPFPGGMIFRP